MDLIQPSYLGSGYHIYMDNFYTSPSLFLELASMKFGACGTDRDNTKGCPSRGEQNALTSKSKKRRHEMDQRGPSALYKVDGHAGSVDVLHNPSGIPEQSEGSERHSLPHSRHYLQQERGWS